MKPEFPNRQPVKYDGELILNHVALTDNGFHLGGRIEKAVQECNAVKENFISRYLAATGARIEDTVLCEQTDLETMTVRYWCEPRSVAEQRPILARCDDD